MLTINDDINNLLLNVKCCPLCFEKTMIENNICRFDSQMYDVRFLCDYFIQLDEDRNELPFSKWGQHKLMKQYCSKVKKERRSPLC